MASEIEITILPDGRFLIPRGSQDQNAITLQVFSGESTNEEHLAGFFSIADESELIFGDSELCG